MTASPFAAGSRKTLRVTQEDLIRTSYLDSARRFPLVIEPNLADINPVSYAANNQDFLEQHGFLKAPAAPSHQGKHFN